MSDIPIVVVGAAGRMGRRLLSLAADHACHVVAAIEAEGSNSIGQSCGHVAPEATAVTDLLISDQLESALSSARVMIDFALAAGHAERVAAAAHAGVAIVSGVTGIDAETKAALATASLSVPTLWAPNMSQGIAALLDLVTRAAQALPDFEVEVHEIHHHHKADAPSGTAIALAERACEAKGDLSKALLCRGRDPGPRVHDEVGVVATRGGDTIGEHTVYLFGAGERIELSHRALSRDIFAHGALRAAQWIASRPAGRYSMKDVVAAAGPLSGCV